MMKQMTVLARRKARGAVTLIVTLMVMIAITIGSFGMIQTSAFETRMTANEQRAKQAMQAAQAGIDFVLAHVAATSVDSAALCATDSMADPPPFFQVSFIGPDPGLPGGIGINFDAAANAAVCNGLDFLVIRELDIWSRGYSQDRESERTLMSRIDLTSAADLLAFRRGPMPPLPPPGGGGPPIVAKGNIHFQGAPEVSLCSVGGVPADAPSCESLAVPGNQDGFVDGTLALAGGNITQQGGDGMPMGPDNFDTDASLQTMSGDDFWTDYAAPLKADGTPYTKAEFELAATLYTQGGTGKGGKGGDAVIPDASFIWVNGDLSLTNQTIGSQENPVTIYVDGSLNFLGNAIIWGKIYVAENATFSRGTSKIMGQILTEGNVDMRGNSSVFGNPTLAGTGADPDVEMVDPNEFWLEYDRVRATTMRIDSWREIIN
jgi:hypothetical protein